MEMDLSCLPSIFPTTGQHLFNPGYVSQGVPLRWGHGEREWVKHMGADLSIVWGNHWFTVSI